MTELTVVIDPNAKKMFAAHRTDCRDLGKARRYGHTMFDVTVQSTSEVADKVNDRLYGGDANLDGSVNIERCAL